jgi:hypothetical protein
MIDFFLLQSALMYSSIRRYVKSDMQLTFVAVFTLLFGYLPTDSNENEANYCFTLNNEIKCESLSNIRLTRLETHEVKQKWS